MSPNVYFGTTPTIVFREVRKTNPASGSSFTAPDVTGYKFAAWVFVTTRGVIQTWNPEYPLNQTTNFFRVFGDGAGDVVGVAMYTKV